MGLFRYFHREPTRCDKEVAYSIRDDGNAPMADANDDRAKPCVYRVPRAGLLGKLGFKEEQEQNQGLKLKCPAGSISKTKCTVFKSMTCSDLMKLQSSGPLGHKLVEDVSNIALRLNKPVIIVPKHGRSETTGYSGVKAGEAKASTVAYDPTSHTTGSTSDEPFVGLAHELLHALHNLQGTFEVEAEGSGAADRNERLVRGIYEGRCEELSENAIRAEAKHELRASFRGVRVPDAELRYDKAACGAARAARAAAAAAAAPPPAAPTAAAAARALPTVPIAATPSLQPATVVVPTVAPAARMLDADTLVAYRAWDEVGGEPEAEADGPLGDGPEAAGAHAAGLALAYEPEHADPAPGALPIL